ncbi:MAG: hypothetical protein IPL63_14880 [Saprospiraceae bacterium]|nr:hypothetical protein [Saprospiraceae bacterium]
MAVSISIYASKTLTILCGIMTICRFWENQFQHYLFSIDFDEEYEFVSNYLDSLENSGSFKSYNDNSLILAKCLALYNSEKLNRFVRKQIDLNDAIK